MATMWRASSRFGFACLTPVTFGVLGQAGDRLRAMFTTTRLGML